MPTLEGVVERITFHNEETGFSVLKVKVRGRRELATVVGTAASPQVGEWVEAAGRWIVNWNWPSPLAATWIPASVGAASAVTIVPRLVATVTSPLAGNLTSIPPSARCW